MTRLGFLFVAIVLAAPARAQPLIPPPSASIAARLDFQMRMDLLRAEADLAAPRAIDRDNQAMSLEARLRADRAAADIEAAARRPAPTLAPQAGPGPYASIPDAALAASEARVRAASKSRR